MKNFEKHVTHFTVVSNDILKRKEISDRARFLLICMLSLPDEWNFSIDGLQKIFTEASKNTISACLKELQQFGYLRIEQIRNSNGHFDTKIYHLYENPLDSKKKAEATETNPYPKNCETEENEENEQKTPYPKKRVPKNEALLNTKYIKYLNNSKKISNSNIPINTNNNSNNDISNVTELNTNDVIDIDDPPITSKQRPKTKDNSFGIDEINCVLDILNLPKTEKREEVSFKKDKQEEKKFV